MDPADPQDGAAPQDERWYLESFVRGQRGSRVRLGEWPFRIGRSSSVALTLPSNMISKEHAEIYRQDGRLHVRDLGSKNGTYVNHERVSDAALDEGDVLHFAHLEFRVGRLGAEQPASDTWTRPTEAVSMRALREGGRLLELLRHGAATAYFQPIVELGADASRLIVAHEALGRGRLEGLPEAPAELFVIAANMGVAPDLSRLFRTCAQQALATHPDVRHLFLNLHPLELHRPGLIESLEALRGGCELPITLEFPETAVVEPGGMTGLRARLKTLGFGLAYDDFGSGQARLLELAEVTPDYLKFDVRLVRGIDAAGPARHKLLESLVTLARDLGVRTLAEGVETAGEARACAQMGFDFAQGYHFGEPCP
jgi:EAL domain-containing protein (putative c-di-GMP-specific phosphodiesterase class I)